MRRAAAFLGASCLLAAPIEAQGGSIDPQCRGGTVQERFTQDACQKALDLFTFMAPQLGGAIAGGNAVSGEHSALRGPGRMSIGFRVNAVRGLIPDLEATTPATTGAVASMYQVEERVVPVPTADVALGIFRGVQIGGSYAFGVDGLLNVSYLPSVSAGDLDVSLPGGSVKLGFGARVALLQESIVTPGISFTWLQRDLPAVDILAQPGSDEIRVSRLQVKTRAWRGVVGKNLGPIGVAIGAGQDTYETGALADVRVVRAGVTYTANISASQQLTRDNAFGSISLNLPMVSLVGEVGRVSGGNLTTFNTFVGALADGAIDYASLGLRVRW